MSGLPTSPISPTLRAAVSYKPGGNKLKTITQFHLTPPWKCAASTWDHRAPASLSRLALQMLIVRDQHPLPLRSEERAAHTSAKCHLQEQNWSSERGQSCSPQPTELWASRKVDFCLIVIFVIPFISPLRYYTKPLSQEGPNDRGSKDMGCQELLKMSLLKGMWAWNIYYTDG